MELSLRVWCLPFLGHGVFMYPAFRALVLLSVVYGLPCLQLVIVSKNTEYRQKSEY